MNWLKPKVEEKILVVEVDKSIRQEPLSEEIVASLATLQHNPGFVWLLNQLRYQRAMLESELHTKRQESLVESEFIKSGINWANWLEDQLRKATNFGKRQQPPREALDAELEAFKIAQAQLELVR